MQTGTERRARLANAADLWDRLWTQGDTRDWRRAALNRVYTRIERILPQGSRVVDIGGGVGELASRLQDTRAAEATVWDLSPAALELAEAKGVATVQVDLESCKAPPVIAHGSWVIATELLEHLSRQARSNILSLAAHATGGCPLGDEVSGAFFSVPNHRLGPEEEEQHTIAFNAMSFRAELLDHFVDVRVEALGPFLLGVCGMPAKKSLSLSVCLPVRDEEEDLEAVLASFRGVADEIVVGVDPRTKDGTRELARLYADVVFELEDPACQDETNPLHDPAVPPEGVHFSWVRNQVVDRCSSDWVFMTEGHERLQAGEEALLALGEILPDDAEVCYVLRQGQLQQWAYPWLFRRDRGFRYERSTHNELRFPRGTVCIRIPQVRTLHDRVHANAEARAKQRRAQNRETLLEDWQLHGNETSLFYLGQELRSEDPEKASELLEEFIALPATNSNGLARYQARLMLAKVYARAGEFSDARRVLLGAAEDDWSRTEHWLWLGDLSFMEDQLEQALQFYRYADTVTGEPPFSVWWIDLPSYSYIPAQRLATTYGHMGRGEDALRQAKRVLELLPEDAPVEVFDECRGNIRLLKEALRETWAAEAQRKAAMEDEGDPGES